MGPAMQNHARRLLIINKINGSTYSFPEGNPRFQEMVGVAATQFGITPEKAMDILNKGGELTTEVYERKLVK